MEKEKGSREGSRVRVGEIEIERLREEGAKGGIELWTEKRDKYEKRKAGRVEGK